MRCCSIAEGGAGALRSTTLLGAGSRGTYRVRASAVTPSPSSRSKTEGSPLRRS